MTGEPIHRYGAGPVPVLALHCGLASGAAWAGIGRALGDLVTLRAPDFPGHGTAPDWDGEGDYQAACVATAREALGPTPAHLFGHSFGAATALRLALEHPELVRSLALYEPVFFAAARGTPEAQRNERDFAPYLAAMQAGDHTEATRAFTSVWGGGAGWDAIPAAHRQYMIDRIPLIQAADDSLIRDPAGLLAPGRLEGLKVPVLLLRGELSPGITETINAALAARLPAVSEVVIDGARHMAPISRPDAVSRPMRQHLLNAGAQD